jgi:hypothetical protein
MRPRIRLMWWMLPRVMPPGFTGYASHNAVLQTSYNALTTGRGQNRIV